jgi:hypothetical protein
MNAPTNPFNKILEQEELPVKHKEEVMNRVDGHRLWFDIVYLLFPIRFEMMGQLTEIFGLKGKREKEKNDNGTIE